MVYRFLILMSVFTACDSSYEIDSIEAVTRTAVIADGAKGKWKDSPTIASGIAYSEKHKQFVLLSDGVLSKNKKKKYPLGLTTNPLTEGVQETVWLKSKKRFDFEDVAFDKKGNLWISDESVPAIYKYSFPELNRKKSLVPGKELPARYFRVQSGRGFEGVAIANDALFVMSQSPLTNKEGGVEGFFRLLRYSLSTGEMLEYRYLPRYSEADTKIGALSALDSENVFILEHGVRAEGSAFAVVYLVSLVEAERAADASTLGDEAALNKKSIVDFREHQIGFSKPEGIEYLPEEHALYLVEDADAAEETDILKINFKPGLLERLRRYISWL